MNDQRNNQTGPSETGRETSRDVEATGKAANSVDQAQTDRSGATPRPAPDEQRTLPRAPQASALALVLLSVLVALWAGVAFHAPIQRGAATLQAQVVAAFRDAKPTGAPEAEGGLYQGPMHPWVVQTEPGTCSICGMDLVPVDPAKFTGELTIDPRVVQNMGVRVEEVTRGPLTRTVRTVGTVDYDETRVRDVNIKVKGWIERLHVSRTGERVTKGQPLFDLYSPELYAAQEELLLAHQTRMPGPDAMKAENAVEGALLGAARTRLLYYDVTPGQIEALLERGKARKTITLRSPHAGTVIEKHANEGMRVTPGMRTFRIADLSQVWVMATVYEYQLPYVHEGQSVTMTLPYLPGKSFEGEVDYVYPYMKENTREVQVRLVFDNADGRLRPGMFASLKLEHTIADSAVLAPREAVLDTGERQVALVSTGGGTFEPRDLKLGPTTGDHQVQILKGLEPGEKVVTSGQFLLDSEAKMRASLARMVEGQAPASTQRATEAEPAELSKIPEKANTALAGAIEAYLRLVDQLAADRFEPGSAPAALDQSLARFARQLNAAALDGADRSTEHVQAARRAAQRLGDVDRIDAAREVTAKLSQAMADLLELTGTPPATKTELLQFHCPMYQEEQGGTPWLQPAGEPRNPYYGAEMLRCHDKKQAVPSQTNE